MIPDYYFGEMIHAEKRYERHVADIRGVHHFQRIEPWAPQAGQAVTLTLTTSGLPVEAARCFYTTSAWQADAPACVDLAPVAVDWDTPQWGYVRVWRGKLPAQPAGAVVRYRIGARLAGSATWVFADNQANSLEQATRFSFAVNDVGQQPPEWARRAQVYHIFVDRFSPGDGRTWLNPAALSGFFGGTLQGILDCLDYVQALGCDVLWLSPIFTSPSHHGYNATDYYQVEPRLGSNADLLRLLDACHQRGMRVLLDFVANHWSRQHPTFEDAQHNPKSPYHDWYNWIHWPDTYETYFGERDLPRLNLAPGPAREALLDCARYWLAQGVDGYRLDYALGPEPDFWTDFGQACRQVKPDCWLFGEVVDRAPIQAGFAHSLDGTLDFLLAQALRETFAGHTWDLAQFEAFLNAHEAYFPAVFSRPAFLDNHDMNRFLYIAESDARRLKLAGLVLFTLSGPPIVYYGTEVGLSQQRPVHQNGHGIFEEARQPMRWGADQDVDLLAYFQRLGALRKAFPVIWQGQRRTLHLDARAETYAYQIHADTQPVWVVINRSAEPRSVRLTAAGFPKGASDRLNGCAVVVSEAGVEAHLPAQTGAFIA